MLEPFGPSVQGSGEGLECWGDLGPGRVGQPCWGAVGRSIGG